MEQVEQDPDFILLSRQFKATALELISVLEQVRVHILIVAIMSKGVNKKYDDADWHLTFDSLQAGLIC